MTTNTTNSQAVLKSEIEEWKHMAMMAARASRKNLERAEKAEAKLAEWDKIVEVSLAQDYTTRATAAESRLAEIQRGVEKLVRFDDHDSGLEISLEAGRFVFRHEVLALLQPQGQAEISDWREKASAEFDSKEPLKNTESQ